MKVVLVANSSWYLANFRLSLALRLREAGHEVVTISQTDRHVERLAAEGVAHRHWNLDAASRRPWSELGSVRALRRLLDEVNPRIVLSYTPKANIYAGLALRGRHARFVPNISGLGHAFVRRSPLAWLVQKLYGLALARADEVFFQNEDDRKLFVDCGLAALGDTRRLPGSGVDLCRFSLQPLPLRSPRVLLFVGRILADKGVLDLVAATRALHLRHSAVEIRLLGPVGARSPTAIDREEIDGWEREGLVSYLGEADDVRPAIAQADAVVLPSIYREGVPRSLLEAASMGRPCITYDMPGCRDAVDHGVTGWLCPPGDVPALTEAIERLLQADAGALIAMGRAARTKMVAEFDEEQVIAAVLAAVDRARL